MTAVNSDQLPVVEFLYKKGANLNARSIDGSTALHAPARDGHENAVSLLLAAGADANVPAEPEGMVTPLHLAVIGGHIEVVRLLLKNRAAVNAVSKGGITQLDLAYKNGNVAMAKLLRKAGAVEFRMLDAQQSSPAERATAEK